VSEVRKLRPFLTVKELAQLLRVSEAYIYMRVKTGEIPCISLPGAVIRFDVDVITNLISGPTPKRVQRSLKTEKRKFGGRRKEKQPLWP
jgi:excisionase family DNA binding protein